MGCILGCFENNTVQEPKILVKNYKGICSDLYIDYYLATRFDLWD